MKHRYLRIAFMFMIIALTAFAVSVGALADGEPWSGSGTEADPWKIATAADLQALAARVNSGDSFFDKRFVLTADVDLSDVCGDQIGVSWDPIGHAGDITFYGVFDGGGHSVTGLYISGGNYRGLFGTVSGTVKDLNVSGTVLGGSSADHVGGVAGMNYGTITGCSFSGTVSGRSYVGGVVGASGPDCRVADCSSAAFVTGYGSSIGGVVGWANDISELEARQDAASMNNVDFCGNGAVSNCEFTGTVLDKSPDLVETVYNADTGIMTVSYSSNAYGGVVGWCSGYTLTDCVNRGTVTCYDGSSEGGGDFIGGVAGDVSDGSVVTDCVNYGTVEGKIFTGGVAGRIADSTITDCENSGTVSGVQLTGGVAGFADKKSSFENCRNAEDGAVAGSGPAPTYTGGVLGLANCAPKGCDNAGTVTGSDYVGGVVAWTTASVRGCNNLDSGKVLVTANPGAAGHIGGVVGHSIGAAGVADCTNYGTVSSASAYTGGVVGYAAGPVTGCVNRGAVSGTSGVGGVVGHADANIANCENYGAVTGTVECIGGVAGEAGARIEKVNETTQIMHISANCTVTGCTNSGTVSAGGSGKVGGILGFAYAGVSDCRNLAGGTVSFNGSNGGADTNVGGIAGRAFGSISYCINAAQVNASSPNGEHALYTGGVLGGGSAAVAGCVNSGSISGERYTGGVVGGTENDVADCTNSGAVTGIQYTGGVLAACPAGGKAIGCENTGTVNGGSFTGGVVGAVVGQVTDCVNSGTVLGETIVGGVAGYSSSEGTLSGCVNAEGAGVTGTGDSDTNVGGIIGYTNGTVSDCTNVGSVKGEENAGGVVGTAMGLITDCANRGTVTADSNTGGVAGAIGKGAVLQNGSNSGTVNGSNYTGGIAGRCIAGGTVSDCVSDENSTVYGEVNTGGIVGIVRGDDTDTGTVIRCENGGTVSGTNTQTGGIAGVSDKGRIESCVNRGAVSGTTSVGGVSGANNDGKITECTNFGDISCSGSDTGGIVGLNIGETEKSENKGSVTGKGHTGGIAGYTGVRVSSCVNRGSVTGNGLYKGGIAGYAEGYVEYCENYGNVTGENGLSNDVACAGGIAGYCGKGSTSSFGTVSDCTNHAALSGTGMGVGGIVGQCNIDGTIERCVNMGIISAGAEQTGGIVGSVSDSTGTVTECRNSGMLVGGAPYVGGIAGLSKGTISKCENNSTINGGDNTGGILGYNNGGTVADCSNKLTFVAGGDRTGGIIGFTTQGSILRCSNIGTVTGGACTGGIVGRGGDAYGYNLGSPIEDCKNSGIISGGKSTGGIVGWGDGDTKITKCENSGAVTGSSNETGGIAGASWHTTVSYCENTGKVKGKTAETGGIVGYSQSHINHCVNSGDVDTGKSGEYSEVGGIAGVCDGRTIDYCTNSGDITGGDQCVGGIAGLATGPIKHSQNSGDIDGGTFVGGIVGQFQGGTLEQCRNTGDAYGYARVGGIAGRTVGETTVKQCSNPNTSAYIHAGDDTNHNRCIGGLVGQFDSGTVENCYSRSLVWGGNRVGGLLGTSGKVTMKQCFCYAPDSNSHFNKEDGVDCEKIKMEGTVYCGALIGETTDSYTLQNCIWYWSCCSWAIDGGGDSHDDIWHDYGWWKVTSNFKTKSQFPSQYDFNNVWTTQNDSSVAALRFEVNDTIYNNPPDPQSPDPLSISIGAPVSGPDKPGPDVDVTEARTISIFTVDDLKALRDAVNGGDTYENATILLCADLDLGDENWTPIGENTDVISFNGTFEGRGHTISGLNANITDTRTAGLFGNIGAAGAVRDLAVSGTVSLVISGGISEYAGGIAGYSKGAVERCVFDGEVTGSSEGMISGFGGIVGYCASSGSVKNCRHSGGVNGGKNAGGIVGYCAGNTENCVHIGGTVSASDNKGGVAGRVNDGSVKNCYALTGSASGIVGYAGLSSALISGSMLSAYELSMQSSYVSFGSHSWNFNSVWAMGERYPLLRCMSETVTLDPNGGAGSVTTVWKPRGGARLPESGFTRDGFVFTGWNTKNDGLGTEYADRAVIDRSVTLYAQWLEGTPYAGYIPMTVTDGYAGVKAEENYTKLLDGNIGTKWCVGGDGVQNGDAFSIEFAAPDYIEPCACAITTGNDAQKYPERNPLKWTLEAKAHAGGEWVLLARSRDDETLPPLNNATMYKPLYTEGEYCYFRLTFRGVSSGNTFQLSEFALLTKTAARQPLISFDPQGGVGAVQTMNAAAESLLVLPGNTYTREGFDFAGWNTAADGSGDAYAAGEGYPVAGDATLYAQWTESTCTVRFLDEDGTSELSTVTVKAGRVPLYNGTAPEKASTATKSYTFTGWTPAVKAVTGNTDYLATFSEEERTYTVTWISGGALLEYDSGISYDTPPQYNGAVPTKPDDTEHTYTFSGWSDGANVYSLTDPLPNVTDDVTFTAQFASAPRKYNITWENWDGTVLRVDPVDYGAAPDYGGEPTRDADAQYSYAFSGWSPAVAAVTGEAKYTAQYTPALRSYTVTWLNYDGTPLRSDENVDYGTVPDYGSVPERPATASTEYTFTEWYPAIQPVSGDATYTAQFGDSTRCYTVKWMNGDSLLEEAPVPYGAMPVYHGAAPVKEDEGYYTYTFAGWTPEVGSVVGEATYSAVFDQATVSFNVHYRSNGALGTMDSASVLRGLTHTLPDSGFTAPSGMIFDTWEIGGAHYAPGDVYTVCADTDVTALWKNLYTVTWVNHDGKLLQSDIVPQGDMPLYTGKEPTKPSDAEYDYAFAGWTPAVTAADGDITYTAVFADVPRTYTVTWKDRDGNVLETDTNVPYGAVPSFDADIPETFDDDLFIYDFLGWSPEVTPVECDAVYTAQYQKTRIEYERDEPYIQQFASSVDAPAGGRIRISPLNAVKGKTVTLTAEPLDGWQLAQLKVYRKSGAKTDIELTDKGSGVFTFTMPDRKIMIDVLFEPIDLLAMFPDLRPNAWYLDDVRWAVSHGVMRGTDRGFEPNGTTSFAMVAQMLLNVDRGFAPTADAGGSDKWYDECMAWLNENGLAKGIPGSIDPNGTISREQVAVLLYNFAAYRGLDVSAAGSLDGFTDADSVSAWAADAMRWAVSSGIVNGMGDGTVDPGGSTTRAQIAALIRRSSGKIGYR